MLHNHLNFPYRYYTCNIFVLNLLACSFCNFVLFFFKDFIYLILERGEGWEKEREKHQCVVASYVAPTGDLAHNPGMCPDWESNQQPFGSQSALNLLSYTSRGWILFLILFKVSSLCRGKSVHYSFPPSFKNRCCS